MMATLKRTNDPRNSNDRKDNPKKQKSNFIKYSPAWYSYLLHKLSLLEYELRNYCVKFEQNGDKLFEQLRDARNSIPIVLVFGQQSSGKSELLNKLFGIDFGLKVGAGLATRCPIEIRAGPWYKDKCYVMDAELKQRIDCDDILRERDSIKNNMPAVQSYSIKDKIQAAQWYIDEKVRSSKDLLNSIIVMERQSDDEKIIIDLPGCNSENDAYMQWVKKIYLEKKETIILHVSRAIDDPDNDNSLKYLQDIKNEIITILTHADLWRSDPGKINNLKQIYERGVNNVALVDSKSPLDDNFLNDLDFRQIEKPKIVGYKNLLSFVQTKLNEKIKQLLPQIEQVLEVAANAIREQFIFIGKEKPNMREVNIQFQIYLEKIIEREICLPGCEFGFKSNELKNMISPAVIYNYNNLIPPCDILAKELKEGSRRQIQGAEGWDSLAKKYIEFMVNEFRQRVVIEFVNIHFYLLSEATNKILSNNYKSCTENIQNILKTKTSSILENYKKDTIAIVNNFLDNIIKNPYNSTENDQYSYLAEIIKNPMKQMIKELYQRKNEKGKYKGNIIDYAYENFDIFFKEILPKCDLENDMYKTNAKIADSHLRNFWKDKSKHIHDHIIGILGEQESLFEEEFKKEIRMVSHKDLVEPEQIEQKRIYLKNVLDSCKKILKTIKN